MTPKQRRALIDQLAHEARGRGLTLERREVAKKKWVWDVRETRAEEQRLRNQRDELLSRARADDALTDPGVKEKLDRLQTGIDRAHAQADEAGQALLNDHIATGDYTTEAGTNFRGSDRPNRIEDEYGETTVLPNARGAREGAMRTLERHVNTGDLTSEAADRVDGVMRGPDAPLGLDARYVEAAGDPHYATAFHKLLKYGDGAILRMTREEQTAVQKTNEAEETRTALTVGSGAGGGFALPISIDPSINLSSNGAINSIRALAEVRTMSTRELRLVTSDGTTAQYQSEALEAVDNSPVLAQPVLIAQRATSFTPSASRLTRTGHRWPPSSRSSSRTPRMCSRPPSSCSAPARAQASRSASSRSARPAH
jgi:hypothetical protein